MTYYFMVGLYYTQLKEAKMSNYPNRIETIKANGDVDVKDDDTLKAEKGKAKKVKLQDTMTVAEINELIKSKK